MESLFAGVGDSYTGDKRQNKWEFRGDRSKNCQNDFSA